MSEIDLLKHISGFSGGKVVYQPHSTLGPRLQRHLQLLYVTEGGMTLRVDENEYRVRPGEISLLLPGHREHFRMDGGNRTCHGWTTAVELTLSAGEASVLEEQPSVMSLNARMRELIRLLEPLLQLPAAEVEMERDALSLALLGQYLREGKRKRPVRRPLPESLRRACGLVEENFPQPLRVTDLARAAGVSPAHLIRLFRRHLQRTPMETLWQRRLEEGERLLRETGLGIAEVAYACGFQTPDHFSRRFKTWSGRPPGSYRRHVWEGETAG